MKLVVRKTVTPRIFLTIFLYIVVVGQKRVNLNKCPKWRIHRLVNRFYFCPKVLLGRSSSVAILVCLLYSTNFYFAFLTLFRIYPRLALFSLLFRLRFLPWVLFSYFSSVLKVSKNSRFKNGNF